MRQFTDTVAARLGPCNVITIEWDDKNRVPIGIAATNKQQRICMGFFNC